jgi:hypothetical protein
MVAARLDGGALFVPSPGVRSVHGKLVTEHVFSFTARERQAELAAKRVADTIRSSWDAVVRDRR